MPAPSYRLVLLIFSTMLFLNVLPANAITALHSQRGVAIEFRPSERPEKKKKALSNLLYKLLAHKKSVNGRAILFGVLSVVLLSLIVFGAAYGGAPGAIVALIAIVGLGLIVFGLIKISKARKRKKGVQ